MTGVTFAVLGVPFFLCAAKLEWDGPTFGSSPTLRKALWAAWIVCTAVAVSYAVGA